MLETYTKVYIVKILLLGRYAIVTFPSMISSCSLMCPSPCQKILHKFQLITLTGTWCMSSKRCSWIEIVHIKVVFFIKICESLLRALVTVKVISKTHFQFMFVFYNFSLCRISFQYLKVILQNWVKSEKMSIPARCHKEH